MRIILCAIFSIFLGCSTSSQNKNRSISNTPIKLNSELASSSASSWIDKVGAIAKDSVDNGYNAGIALGIIDESGKQTIYTFGKMDVALDKAISKSTLFEIGSITKVLTSELLAKYVIEGKLNLDDKVSKFIPELEASDVGKITLRELSTHSSGLPRMPNNMKPKDSSNPYVDYTEKQFMSSLSSYKETKSKPYGYHYSNLGYALLSHILTLNKDYEVILKQEILEKFNSPMAITLSQNQKDNFATPYSSTFEQTTHWDLGVFNGAGGVRGTIQDLLDFAQSELTPESTSLKDAILLSQATHYQADDGQLGLGWYERIHPDGLIYSKDGGTGGFSSLILFQPKTGRALTLLSNSSNIVPCLINYFKGEECEIKKTYSMSMKQLERFVGEFENEGGDKLSIITSANQKYLVVNIPKQQPWVLKAESSTVFNFTEINVQIVFPEGDKRIESFVLKQGGKDFIYKKVERI